MLQNQVQSKVRNSSIELLRIISMLMIVLCHFATHGGFDFDIKSVSIPRLWWGFIEMGGNLGVDIFVLISGYFLTSSTPKKFNLKRVLKFLGQVVVYSVAIYLILCAIGVQDFGTVSFVLSFFPITFKKWWFASTYFVLYLIHPFINMLLRNLDRKSYQSLLAMQLILWCIIPTFAASSYQSNSLVWFVTLYCVAGYIRQFGLNPKFTAKGYFGFFLIFSAIRYLSCVILMVLGTRIPFLASQSLFFYGQQSILTFLCAVTLFMTFEKCDIGYIKWINTVASATFGVYLIHDNKAVRSLLWKQLFGNSLYQESVFIIPYSIIVLVIVYVSCTLIDLMRQLIVEKPFLMIVNRCSEIITKPFEKLLGIVNGFVFGKND